MDVMHPCVTNTTFVVPIQRTVHHKNESLNDDNSLSIKIKSFPLLSVRESVMLSVNLPQNGL